MAVLLTFMLFRSLCCKTFHSVGHMVSPEYGNEPSGSIQDREFTDSLRDYQLLKKESVLWFTCFILST